MTTTPEPDHLGGTRGLFLLLIFLAELAAWAAIGLAAYSLAPNGWGIPLAVGAAAVTLVLWGLLASPKAKAPPAVKIVVQWVVFAAAVAGLIVTGYAGFAGALAGLIVSAKVGERVTRRTLDPSVTGS